MADTPQAVYTALHGSLATCDRCGNKFEPRIRSGPNKDRFCQTSCHDEWWNDFRRRNPPTVLGTGAAGEVEEKTDASTFSRWPTKLKPGTKLHAVAAALCRGERLDCFMAVRRFHDYVLRSTVSELEHRYGIRIDRQTKQVPGFAGKPIHCSEYSAGEQAIARLARLLGWQLCQSNE